MFVTYTPEDGGAKQEWDFIPGRVRVSEQVLVEKRAEARWSEWVAECKIGQAAARRVLLWHLIRREHPGLRWEDTPDFYADELLVEMSVLELTEWRDKVPKLTHLSEAERDTLLTECEAQIEESRAKHGDGASGKASLRTDLTVTAG